jgi:hypothetical protein
VHDQTKIMRIAPETDRSTLSDAELVASYAREALELGRYPLGAELARLADRAARVGARPAGHDAAQAALFGHRVADVPLIGQTREEHPRSHAPSTCAQVLELNGSRSLCNQPIGWTEIPSNAPGHTGEWYHLDPEITDHAAVPAGY